MIGSEFLFSIFLWFVRAFLSSIVCLIIGLLGMRMLSFETTRIREFESIKGHPLATSLFLGGFFVYAGLVIYGSMVNPFFLSQSVSLGTFFNVERFLIVILSFLVSFIFGSLFYYVFSKLKLFNVDLDDINKHPVAVGVFLFCYQVFLGLIILASLNIPLG
ncbi:MAG: hypothetical protein ABSA11_04260 [Candidatus Bathyarchaeia archaeon]|jgi:uncharacterized membrane protein YjfL (UPF0719 family)